MRVKSAMLLRLLSCALMFWLFAQLAGASGTDEVVFPESKLGRDVLFPGIDEPVRVAMLESAAGRASDKLADVLPVKVLDSIIRARDRNACWLVCERRRDYVSFSYTFVFEDRRIQPTRGRYDRGVYLKLPSEYVLYYGDWRAYEYMDEEGYFKIKLKPAGKPEKGKKGEDLKRHSIPNYLDWASMSQMVQPIAWKDELSMVIEPILRDMMDYQYGFELWFDEHDLKLCREFITVPTEPIGDDGTVHLDTDNPKIAKEVHYGYWKDVDYPSDVTIIQNGHTRAELRFQFIDGFWVLNHGMCYWGSEPNKFYISLRDVSIER
jgi:hypothetical protein